MLSELVTVEERFQRSIRIENDLNKQRALQGFICPNSSKKALTTLANHVKHTKQSAFTWTGPYGSGKSSLAVLFAALCGQEKELRKHASEIIGQNDAQTILSRLPFSASGYNSIPVLGMRDEPAPIIGQALQEHEVLEKGQAENWSVKLIINSLRKYINNKNTPGIILFIDEMGRFLEAAAQDSKDIHLFQELAEEANRSNGKFILISILHQAFASYANELSFDMRDEWTKIQGRYVDIIINPIGEEQIYLLGQAIKKRTQFRCDELNHAAAVTAKVIGNNKAGTSAGLVDLLKNSWPLHPVSAILLAALARKRFGQNQRSIFAFLNSAEPYAFQSFLTTSSKSDLYYADLLWDYLKVNFEPAIVSSSDGHKWLLAADAIDRCYAIFDDPIYTRILKIIALLDLFRQVSGLAPTEELLEVVLPIKYSEGLSGILQDLVTKSFITYRRYLSAYAIYAGSDFDIEEALRNTQNNPIKTNLKDLEKQLNTKILLARRHFFETGSHRWIDIKISTPNQIQNQITKFEPDASLFGRCLLIIPEAASNSKDLHAKCLEGIKHAEKQHKCVLFALPKNGQRIIEYYRELTAYGEILKNHPELQGDQVARREIDIRSALVQSKLNTELQRALLNSEWFLNDKGVIDLDIPTLNAYISTLADQQFPYTPRIHNELLNRTKPSGSAIAGQNALLRAMVYNAHKPRLGIKGYPVEAGLYDSIIQTAQLHRKSDGRYKFICPTENNDPLGLSPLWEVAINHLKKNLNELIPIEDIHKLWCGPRYGLKKGLIPLLSTAFILSLNDRVAIYREEVFRHEFTDTDVTYLARNPRLIQLRWVDLGKKSEKLLHAYCEVANKLNCFPGGNLKTETQLQPIQIARALIKIYDSIPEWSKRTQELTNQTRKLRNILHNAFDPNELLFIDLPQCYSTDFNNITDKAIHELTKSLYRDLFELINSYPKMLEKLKSFLLSELRADTSNTAALEELRQRATKIQKSSGNFRLNAFINHILRFDGTLNSMERIASLAANKPPHNWVDLDFNRAFAEIAEFAEQFIKTELYRKIENQEKYWHSYAVMYKDKASDKPVIFDFHVNDKELNKAEELVGELKRSLKNYSNIDEDIILAALAHLSGEIIKNSNGK